MRLMALASVLLGTAACAAPSSPPLVSAQSPPGTGPTNSNSPLQSLNSLPPGAANRGFGPNSVQPDYAHITFRAL